MLHILRGSVEQHRVVLILQGRIAGDWVDMLERECLELLGSGRHVVLDLAGVDFIGRSGLEVLVCLAWAGAGIVGCSPLIADVLEQEGIEVSRNGGGTDNGNIPDTKR